jgi:hypothetical protein
MEFEEPTLTRLYGQGKEASQARREAMNTERASLAAIPGLDEFIQDYPAFEDAECVFASGSLTEGWAHAKSDLDLFGIFSGTVTADSLHGLELIRVKTTTSDPTSWIALGEVGPYRADIEVWSEAQVDELIGRFTGTGADKYTVRPNPAERDLLYRISKALPLAGEAWLEARQQALKESAYGAWLAENQKADAEGLLEDVSGLLESGDAHSAALAAHRGFMIALGSLLAAYGDYSPSQKWLYRRLDAVRPEELTTADGWRVMVMDGCAADPAGWAERTARLSQRMLTGVELRVL